MRADKPAIRPLALQSQDQVHSPRLRIDSHVFPQHAFQARRCRFPALGIELAHPLDMAREMAFRDEGRDDGLRKLGAAPCESLADLLEPLDLRFRHDKIGKPNARKKHLAEGACIKDPPITIQALQRGQGTADISVLAVVIVFDDPCAVSRGPIQ